MATIVPGVGATMAPDPGWYPTRVPYGSVDLLARQSADRERGYRFCRICGCTDRQHCAEGCKLTIVPGEELTCSACRAWLAAHR